MTDPAARAELAAALTQVDGLNVTPYYRQVTKPGEGIIKLAGLTAATNGFGFVTRWQAWICVPQDRAAAEKWIEAHHDPIVAALKRLWTPTVVVPIDLQFDTTVVNGVIYEGIR